MVSLTCISTLSANSEKQINKSRSIKASIKSFSQVKESVAEGKRKEESGSLVLSLQDVFSESENLEGMQQKTFLPTEIERRKKAQLEGKGKRKPKGGRKKLQPCLKRTVKLQAHVTQVEYEKLGEQFKATGMRYLSDYLRLLILNGRTAGSIANKQELIKQLDKIRESD